MEEQQRDFKGVWISKEVWLDERLNALEKIILVEIDSLDCNEDGCYATNEYLAEFCQCSATKVSNAIKKLVDLGYIYIKNFNGRTRFLKSRLTNFVRQTYKFCKADLQKMKGDNIYNNNIYNNKENNKENNIENNIDDYKEKEYKEKEPTIDDILSSQPKELQENLKDFLKMRKSIKKPMTTKAFKLLLNNLNKLGGGDFGKENAILEQSILNSWQGVFALKNNNSLQPKQTQQEDWISILKKI